MDMSYNSAESEDFITDNSPGSSNINNHISDNMEGKKEV